MKLGTIEGFYGKPWSWEARKEWAHFSAQHGYAYYIYAPKADPYLRKKWREPIPLAHLQKLSELRKHYQDAGVEFGVGFSPFEIYRKFDVSAMNDLCKRLQVFSEMRIDTLAILLDDMRGDIPDLAEKQAEILHFIRDSVEVKNLILCPTYYSNDPKLDEIFGQRPERYLAELGDKLDRSIDIFWTGEKVCAKDFPLPHIEKVGELLGRKPFLWDNYPVNDGPKMSRFLHLEAFTGRPAELEDRVSGHAINPMNQMELSKIPALTLVQSYHHGSDYRPEVAFRESCEKVLPKVLAMKLIAHRELFNQKGLDQIESGSKELLIKEYGAIPHPAAHEIAAWLKGEYAVNQFVE